jgi:hypothetical protein
LLKDIHKSTADPKNYRPISITPVIAKIFESCISPLLSNCLQFHTNQFGFVEGGGCSKALYAFQSIVNYFSDRKSTVYFVSLDAVKAFDRLNHFYLFSCMIDRGYPPQLVNIFQMWFRNMYACVNWNNCKSEFFKVSSGVPQGSILGSKLYNMIMDNMLTMLDSSNLGCSIGGRFAGAIAYADDMLLLSASCIKMQSMLELCTTFGQQCDLKFNVEKSCCGCIGKQMGNVIPKFDLNGFILPWVTKLKYLGSVFLTGKCLQTDCSERVHKFIASVSSILRYKVTGYEHIFADILIKKCLPILFYGFECCALSSVASKTVRQSWNLAFKWLYNLKKYDSSRLLFLYNNTMSMKYILDCRMLLFFRHVGDSSNLLLHKINLSTYNLRHDLFNKYNLPMCEKDFFIKKRVNDIFLEYCVEKLL